MPTVDMPAVAAGNAFQLAPIVCFAPPPALDQIMDPNREKLVRRYAAGEITWTALRDRGFDDYVQLLGGLGELGLRPPVAAMIGPTIAARQRGRALLDRLLREQPRA